MFLPQPDSKDSWNTHSAWTSEVLQGLQVQRYRPEGLSNVLILLATRCVFGLCFLLPYYKCFGTHRMEAVRMLCNHTPFVLLSSLVGDHIWCHDDPIWFYIPVTAGIWVWVSSVSNSYCKVMWLNSIYTEQEEMVFMHSDPKSQSHVSQPAKKTLDVGNSVPQNSPPAWI